MKKLKILLPFNLIICLFFIMTIIMLMKTFSETTYESERVGSQEVEGTITYIEKTDYNTKITVKDTLISTDGDFELGDKVSCKGIVEVPSFRRNFYLFDYQKYLASKRIYYTMKADCVVESKNTFILYSIKNWLIQTIEKRKSSRYLKAFLLGNTKEISDEVKKSYQVNGISHLFSVSGMHISFFFLLFGFLKNEKRKNLFLFFFLLFYLFLTNFSPSVMRASLFFFFSKPLKKIGFTTIQSYLVFTMTMLWYQPYFLYHTGFLYSFTISFFLIFFSKYISNEKNYMKNLMKISVFSLLASVPIQIETNFSINLLSIFYNLLFVPVVSILLFPLSFLVFFFPILDSFYSFLFSILETFSLFLSNIPSKIVLCHLPWIGIFFYYMVNGFVMHKMTKKEYKYCIVIFIVLGIHYILPLLNPKGIVIMMDVGQGDSILVVYPHKQLTFLVDTGGAFYDTGTATNTIIPTLHAHGITSLDYLVLSHGDLDHLGEALSFLKNFKVKEVLLNSGNNNEKEIEIMKYLDQKKLPHRNISTETIVKNSKNLQFLNSKDKEDENEDSLVTYFSINNYTFLFMGDSGKKTELEILKEYNLPKVDILKVGHHGSKYSSSEEFIASIQPTLCLISAGENNRYGHPHKETLENLKLCDTYITSVDGAIKVEIGKSMLVTTVR